MNDVERVMGWLLGADGAPTLAILADDVVSEEVRREIADALQCTPAELLVAVHCACVEDARQAVNREEAP